METLTPLMPNIRPAAISFCARQKMLLKDLKSVSITELMEQIEVLKEEKKS